MDRNFKLAITIFLSVTLSGITIGIFFKLWNDYEARMQAEAIQRDLESLTAKLKLESEKAHAEAQLQAQQLKLQSEQRAKQMMLEAEQRATEAAERNRQMQIQRNNEIAANEQKQRTCNFWRNAYAETRTEGDKNMMNLACN